MRLDNFVSKALNVGRKEASKIVRSGTIRVADQVVKDPAFSIADQAIFYGDQELFCVLDHQYFLLHKPAGYICSATAEAGYDSALDLVDTTNKKSLHFAGRLDSDTTGAVLISSDGNWTHRITTPKNNHPKAYIVTLREELTADQKKHLENGVLLRGEKSLTKPAVVELISDCVIRLTITEGRYHQVKRMCAAVGNKVASLHRESVGSISVAGLEEGEVRALANAEILSF